MVSICSIVLLPLVISAVHCVDYDPDEAYYNEIIGRYARRVGDLPQRVDNAVNQWHDKTGRQILQGIS